MRRLLFRLAIVATLIGGASVALAKMSGPPASRTGAWSVGGLPAESNCQFCHDPAHALNDPAGVLEILDLPEQFALDTEYPLRVRLAHALDPAPPDPRNWGFQLTAVRADSGTGYGTFVVGPDLKVLSGLGGYSTRRYVEHTAASLHTGETGPVEWSFVWRSPSYPASKVYFFVAGNASDGDQLSSGDYIFTAADSASLGTVSAPTVSAAGVQLAAPWPNPAGQRAWIHYAIGTAGIVDLAIFDVQGRRLRTLVREPRLPGPASTTWDGRDDDGAALANGLYFIKLVAPGLRAPLVQKIVWTR